MSNWNFVRASSRPNQVTVFWTGGILQNMLIRRDCAVSCAANHLQEAGRLSRTLIPMNLPPEVVPSPSSRSLDSEHDIEPHWQRE